MRLSINDYAGKSIIFSGLYNHRNSGKANFFIADISNSSSAHAHHINTLLNAPLSAPSNTEPGSQEYEEKAVGDKLLLIQMMRALQRDKVRNQSNTPIL